MGVIGQSRGCRWVRARLPLLAGGELTGVERRGVERHLLGCPDCRAQAASLEGVLGVLHRMAEDPRGADGPSLWPALAHQIREARHETRPTLWDQIRTQLGPALGLATAALATGALAAVVDLPALWRSSDPWATVSREPRPSAPGPVASPRSLPRPAAPGLEPGDPANMARSSIHDPNRPARFDYDLDHGTPLGRDARDIKPSY
jgi:anti-sigma factor RsiW